LEVVQKMISAHKKLEFWAGLKPDELAFVDGKKEITFAELNIHTLKVTSVLRELGIDRGDLVCTMLPAYLDWPVTLALQIIGATSFAKPTSASFDLYAEPKWLIALKEHPQFSIQNTIVVDQNFAERVNDAESYIPSQELLDPSNLMRLCSTSGTSGETKYLAYSFSDMFSRLFSPSAVTFVGNGKFLNLMHFGAAQSYFWAQRALNAGKTYFTSGASNDALFEFLRKYSIETIYGSPQQISIFMQNLRNAGQNLDSNFNLVLGGSAPSPKMLEMIREENKCSIFNAHGSAETGFISACDVTLKDAPGLLIYPNSIVEVVDENDSELSENQIGLLRYKVPGACTSYLNNPDQTKKSFRDGFFYSGDMGYKSDDGRLHITGRSNEVINFGGVKINPEQVDALLLTEIGIQDAASFALDDETGIPKLAVALVVDHEFDEEVFLSAMKVKFTRAKISRVFKVNAVPRNQNGKILRRELSRKFNN